MPNYNPIVSVDGVAVPCPSDFTYQLEDISAADAGRTEDGVMHKKRIGQVVALELAWKNVPTSVVSQVLTAFNPEYITVVYLDAMAGTTLSKVFYVGNRSAPMYNCRKGLWTNVSFKIIEQGA